MSRVTNIFFVTMRDGGVSILTRPVPRSLRFTVEEALNLAAWIVEVTQHEKCDYETVRRAELSHDFLDVLAEVQEP